MDYDAFDRQVMDRAMRRAFAVDERLPDSFGRLLDRIADADRKSKESVRDAPEAARSA